MSRVRWELGPLNLADRDPGVNERPEFWFETLADGFDLGSPEAERYILASLAPDGDDERIRRHGNRSVGFRTAVCAMDSQGLSAGQNALALQVGSTNLLKWVAPDRLSEVTVFPVRTSEMKNDMSDLELVPGPGKVLRAYYALTLRCEPFVRPESPTVVALTYGTATSGTSLRDGTSTSGVSATSDGITALTLSTTTYLGDTAIKGTPATPRNTSGADAYDEYVFTGVALSGAYLAVDWAMDPGLWFDGRFTAEASVVGMDGNPVAVEILVSGYRRVFFRHSLAGQTVTIKVRSYRGMTSPSAVSAASYVGGLAAWSSAPNTGLNVFKVGGSQRTPFSLKLGRTSAGSLGRVGVFSDPQMLASGYNPSIAASWEAAPSGTYTVVVPGGGAGTTLYGLTINGQTAFTRSEATSVPLFFEFHLGAARSGRLGPLSMSWTADGIAGSLPPLWFFRKGDECALTFLKSVPYRYLWVDQPTLDVDHVGLWGGNTSDGSDAVSVAGEAYCADRMYIEPATASLWVSAAALVAVDSEVTYFRRSHTFI